MLRTGSAIAMGASAAPARGGVAIVGWATASSPPRRRTSQARHAARLRQSAAAIDQSMIGGLLREGLRSQAVRRPGLGCRVDPKYGVGEEDSDWSLASCCWS